MFFENQTLQLRYHNYMLHSTFCFLCFVGPILCHLNVLFGVISSFGVFLKAVHVSHFFFCFFNLILKCCLNII